LLLALVLLLAGDLAQHGALEEAKVVAEEFGDLAVPVLACSVTTITTATPRTRYRAAL
jgi:hypothetical protein